MRRTIQAAAVLVAATAALPEDNANAAQPPDTHWPTAATWQRWADLWNGDTAKASQLVAPEFQVHAALIDGTPSSAIRGPEGLVGMINQIRAPFPTLEFTTEVGPIRDGDMLVGRWKATGRYAGGFPGATVQPGTQVTFTGVDILRVRDGKLVEYWFNADMLHLLRQLGVAG